MAKGPLTLVTGSAGHIGQPVIRELLARGHAVRGLDRRPTPGLPDAIVGDIMDAEVCRRAMADVTTLTHLAATPDDVDDPVHELFGPNIVGVFRVFEAARQAKVKRLIVASSVQVVWNQHKTGPLPIGDKVQPSPRGWYAATKLFLEGAARAFADTHGISTIVVRVGWCPRPGQEELLAATPWGHDIYLSPGDAGRFFACAVETAAQVPFAIVYATSRPARQTIYDLSQGQALLGFEPSDCWPKGLLTR